MPSEEPAKIDAAGGEALDGAFEPAVGGLGEDLVAVAAVGRAVEGADVDDLGFGEDAGALFLGEVEIVFVEGVLGVVAAADHAASAGDAGLAGGAFAVEVGVGRGRAGWVAFGAEEDGDVGGVEGVGYAGGDGHLLELEVGGGEDGVGDDAQHALGGGVVGGHDVLPVVEAGPGAVVPEGVGRDEHGVGVGDGATAYGVAVEDENVAEEAEVEEAAQAELGLPEVAVEGQLVLGRFSGVQRRPISTTRTL